MNPKDGSMIWDERVRTTLYSVQRNFWCAAALQERDAESMVQAESRALPGGRETVDGRVSFHQRAAVLQGEIPYKTTTG